jgi:hypothetical protein
VKTVAIHCDGCAQAPVQCACDRILRGSEQKGYLFESTGESDLFVILEDTSPHSLTLCNKQALPVVDITPYFSLDSAHACTKYMHVRH